VSEVITIVLALAAAMSFAVAGVLEQRSTKQVPQRPALSPKLLVDLAHRPLWLAAIGATIAGSALQIAALHFGALALVQPILVCDLLFAVVLAAVTVRHRAPDKVMLAGCICCAGGLACFLAVARPGGGRNTVTLPAVLPLAVVLAAVLAGCLMAASRGSRRTRPLALALACGVTYGVTAFLLKLVSYSLSEGFSQPLRQWPLYAVLIVGPVGFLLNQSAFQADILLAPVLAIITTADPLVSIGIAHLWLDESIASTPADIAAQAAGLVIMAGGIIALAHRAPQVAREQVAAVSLADGELRPTGGGTQASGICSNNG
jgi:drug/metabolite transporter (DMT)-like permease